MELRSKLTLVFITLAAAIVVMTPGTMEFRAQSGLKPVLSVGGSAAGDVLSLLAEDVVLVVFGAMASPTLAISSGDVIFKQVSIKGFWGSKVFAAMSGEKRAALMGELVTGIGSGALTLPVETVYGLDEIADAVRANGEPGRRGKVLLRP